MIITSIAIGLLSRKKREQNPIATPINIIRTDSHAVLLGDLFFIRKLLS